MGRLIVEIQQRPYAMNWLNKNTLSLHATLTRFLRSLQRALPAIQNWRVATVLRQEASVIVVAQVLVLLLGVIDYLIGATFQFAIIYLIPIAYASLRGGVTSGTITALSSTATWIAADALSGSLSGTGWIPYWNGLSRLAGFVLMVILLTRSKQLNSSLVEKAKGLGLEIERRKRTETIYADEKQILQYVACDRPLIGILEALTGKIEQWYEGMLCSLFLFDGESNRFFCIVAPSLPAEMKKRIQKLSLNQPAEHEGAASGASAFLSFDLVTDPAWANLRRIALEYALHPRCSKPLISATGDLLGILSLFSQTGGAADSLNLALFEKARDIASIAIERSRLNKELRKLSELVIEAQEAERRRIARDLHDSVNQVLSSAAFRLGMIDAQISGEHKEIKEELERTKLLLTKGIDEIHRISDDLRPSELDALGLVPALRGLCREFTKKTALALKFECQPSAKRLSDAVELTIYRIIQEALNNIEKHSGASRATLHLDWDSSFINLVVRDNGRGLGTVSDRVKHPKKLGMGILNMRERTAFLGGTFSIQSMRDKGTEIVVKIPLSGMHQIEEVA